MPRRVSLPGASELFRGGQAPAEPQAGTASGRVRHDEKITVYVSAEELIKLEQARLTLRAQGIAVDRGRLVRAAIAAALADLEENGEAADVIARLGD
ncbi:MAG TPA: hypothetical protein VLS51_12290 [Propionibacteriaceae bacterium]|nr:hypothetical protein [Propionibacteriaceae bacterium]